MKLAMYLRIWKWDAISTYLLHYSGKQEEMVLDTLVRRRLSFCFPLVYSIGLTRRTFNPNFWPLPTRTGPHLWLSCVSCVLVVLVTW